MSESKLELAWVTFAAPARMDSQSSSAPGCARNEATKLFKGKCDGETVVFIEDASLRIPGIVPWANVASFGVWIPPAPEVALELDEVDLAEVVKRGPGRPRKDAT